MANGLLDFLQTPAGTGLLSAVAGGAANARRGAPWNNVGRGLLSGLAGYSQTQEDILRKQQLDEAKKMRDLQAEQMQFQLNQMKGQQAWKAGLPSVMEQSQPKVEQFKPDTFDETDNPFGQMANVTPGNPQALQDYLMKAESPFADKILEKQLFPKAPEHKVVGNTLLEVGAGGVKPVFTAEDKAKPTEISRLMAERDALPPDSPKRRIYDNAISKQTTHAPAPSATVNQFTEKEENKAVGKHFGEQYTKTQEAGLMATSKINKYTRLNQLLEGVNTGKFTPLGVEVASAAQSLGFNIDPKLGNKQAAEALSNEMALELRNPSGGAGMPGAMSDQDRAFLQNMVPNLSKTPEGRKLMTETATKLAKRDQDVAKMARDYRKKRGTIDEGFYEELQKYSEANPLFPAQKPSASSQGVRRYNPATGRIE